MSKFIITGSDPATEALVAAGILREEELNAVKSVTLDFAAGSAAQVTVVKFLDDGFVKAVLDGLPKATGC